MAKSPRSPQSTEAAAQAQDLPSSYEAAMAELDALVQRMERGELSLEASLAAYQRGAVLVQYAQEVLGKVEQQIQVLESAQGAEQLVPYTAQRDAGDE